jgi:predicted dehydrogenase
MRIITQLGATVVVCHTRHRGENASWLAENYPDVTHATSLKEALESQIDGVVIVTPRQSHAALTIECLRRGLPVLVEKPAVTSLVDLERTHAEARARGLVLRTGYTHWFDESIRWLGAMARQVAAPRWRFTWTKPAPGTDTAELIWEYYPHVFSIAELMGGVDTDRMWTARLRAVQCASGAATVDVELPMRVGTGRVTVSSALDARHKWIRLYDGQTAIAEWRDRRLLDLRRNRLLTAQEEPLLCQVRGFLEAIALPDSPSQYAMEKTITSLLVQLDMSARASRPYESSPEVDEEE